MSISTQRYPRELEIRTSITIGYGRFGTHKGMDRAGLPWSGKNIWKMKFFTGQEKVKEFCGWPVKFRKDLESQGI